MLACALDPRLDSQLQRAPTKQMTRRSGQSCFGFYHPGCSAALINSNWLELDEDRHERARACVCVYALVHTHTHTQTLKQEGRQIGPAPVGTRFCPLQPADTEVLGLQERPQTDVIHAHAVYQKGLISPNMGGFFLFLLFILQREKSNGPNETS